MEILIFWNTQLRMRDSKIICLAASFIPEYSSEKS